MGLTGLLNKGIFRGKQRSCDKLKGHVIRWYSWDQYELFGNPSSLYRKEITAPTTAPRPKKTGKLYQIYFDENLYN